MPSKVSSDFFNTAKPVALVVGGAGFLGSNICNSLLNKNIKVVCVDNRREDIRNNLKPFLQNKDFLLLEKNITKKIPLGVNKVNYVVHTGGIEFFLENEKVTLETLDLNSVSIKRYLQLAKRHDAKFVLISPVRTFLPKEDILLTHHEVKKFAEALVREYGEENNCNSRIVRIGDLYGTGMNLSGKTLLGSVIKSSLYQVEFKVPRSYTTVTYPTYIDDVSEGIVKSLFSSGTKNKTITILGQPTSLNEIVQTIKFIGFPLVLNTDPTIVFPKDWGKPIPEKISNLWECSTKLKDGLFATISAYSKNNKIVIKNNEIPTKKIRETVLSFLKNRGNIFAEKKLPKLNFHKVLKERKENTYSLARQSYFWQKTIVIFLLTFPLFMILGLPFLEFGLGLLSFSFAQKGITRGDGLGVQNWSAGSEYLLKLSSGGFYQLKGLPLIGEKFENFSSEARLLSAFAGTVKNFGDVLNTGQSLMNKITNEDSADLTSETEKLTANLKSIEKQLAFLETEIEGSEIVNKFNNLSSDKKITKENIAIWRKSASGFAEILPAFSNILGVEKKKSYLVLFQNNAELRPTGGFIGAFGLISFEKARVISFDVFDVYTADGQLKGHVDPPQPIKDYLGEGGWYLRDSNWSPDFPTSAVRAAWFLDKEMGYKVDGVFAVDLEFLRILLKESGPVSLSDYNEILDYRNFYEKIQSQAEKNFFPGSTNKKDYLTALSKTLFRNILDLPEKYLPALVQAISLSLDGRHFSLWFEDPKISQVFTKYSWDGSIATIPCRLSSGQTSCSSDYLQIVEANLGINKANSFLKRSYVVELGIDQGKILHRLVIAYKNDSVSGVWPGGDYKNYLRLYTNSGSWITRQPILVDNRGNEQFLTFTESMEKGKKVFGTLFSIPAGEERQFIASWETPIDLDINKKGNKNLMFYWQKQAGLTNDPLQVRVNFPVSEGSVNAFPWPALTKEGVIGYNANLARDFIINIVWQPKNTN